jgi:hypothetical protein
MTTSAKERDTTRSFHYCRKQQQQKYDARARYNVWELNLQVHICWRWRTGRVVEVSEVVVVGGMDEE